MRYAKLGELDVSVVVMGCGNFGGMGSAPDMFGKGDNEQEAYALLDAALAAGITTFDTANSYGGGVSEDWLGRWLTSRGVRDDVVLATKVGNRVGPEDSGLSAAQIHRQVDVSLRKLNTDVIDLYLTHLHDPGTPVEETVGAFDELVRAGKIRHYGLSNFTGAQLSAAVAAAAELGMSAPVNLQNGYNLIDRDAGLGTFDVCTRHGIGFTAYSPLAGGILTGKYRHGVPVGSRRALRPDWYSSVPDEVINRVVDQVDALAADRGVRPESVALAWVLTDAGVTGAVVAPRSAEQIAAMVAAADVDLTPAERVTLSG